MGKFNSGYMGEALPEKPGFEQSCESRMNNILYLIENGGPLLRDSTIKIIKDEELTAEKIGISEEKFQAFMAGN